LTNLTKSDTVQIDFFCKKHQPPGDTAMGAQPLPKSVRLALVQTPQKERGSGFINEKLGDNKKSRKQPSFCPMSPEELSEQNFKSPNEVVIGKINKSKWRDSIHSQVSSLSEQLSHTYRWKKRILSDVFSFIEAIIAESDPVQVNRNYAALVKVVDTMSWFRRTLIGRTTYSRLQTDLGLKKDRGSVLHCS